MMMAANATAGTEHICARKEQQAVALYRAGKEQQAVARDIERAKSSKRVKSSNLWH
jgi:hypothetical protein